MRSRATTYVLIVAALAVWGFVAWRIFFPRSDTPAAAVHRPVLHKAPEAEEYLLRLDYPDPFLKDAVPVETAVEGRARGSRPAAPPRPQPVVAPADPGIRYAGTITAGGEVSYMFERGGLLHPLSVGETLDGYTLTATFGDSVKVAKDGMVFTLYIQR